MMAMAPSATLPDAEEPEEPAVRVFKTADFSKAAKKAGIKDKELCKAIKEVREGKCDDLGGGVYKKRLDKNRHRSIVLAKGGKRWFYTYLFAKKDLDNIPPDALAAYKKLAKEYAGLAEKRIDELLEGKDLVEICNEDD